MKHASSITIKLLFALVLIVTPLIVDGKCCLLQKIIFKPQNGKSCHDLGGSTFIPSGAASFQYGLGILASHTAKLCDIRICGDGTKPPNFSMNCAVGGNSACSFGNCWCDACIGDDTGRDAIDNFRLIHGDNVGMVNYAILI